MSCYRNGIFPSTKVFKHSYYVCLPSSTLNNIFYKYIVESSLHVEYILKVY